MITSHQSIRNHALNIAKTDYVFFVRSVAQIEDPEVLTNLVQTSTEIVGPLFKTYHTVKVNFLLNRVIVFVSCLIKIMPCDFPDAPRASNKARDWKVEPGCGQHNQRLQSFYGVRKCDWNQVKVVLLAS